MKTKIYGIFKKESTVILGTGQTRKKHIATSFWIAKEIEFDNVKLRLLDDKYNAKDEFLNINRDELFESYELDTSLSYNLLSKPLIMGRHHLDSKDYAKAEQEFIKVKQIDNGNIKALFGLGEIYLSVGKKEKSEKIFEEIMELKEDIYTEHKYLFNDFGITLRKSFMFKQAVDYYNKCIFLDSNDENIYFNLARAYFQNGDIESAKQNIAISLTLNPEHALANKFNLFLKTLDK